MLNRSRTVTAAILIAILLAAALSAWVLGASDFRYVSDVMRRNGVSFQPVEPSEAAGDVRIEPAEAEEMARDLYTGRSAPHWRAHLLRIEASHIRGSKGKLVYAVRVEGYPPGPITRGDGSAEDFVVLVPAAADPDAPWSAHGLPAEPPYLHR